MRHRWLLLLLMGVVMATQLWLSQRQSLWGDEAFSLAMATGHSVEHPASAANRALGDFVEAPTPIPASELRRYTEHEQPAVGWGRVLRAVRMSDTSPPLYYLLLNVWTRIGGTSDLALRSFSILFAVACLPCLVSIGRDLGGELTGWIAGGLFALAPFSVYFCAEGRMYSLLWLCVLATIWAALRLYRGENSRVASVVWLLASVAGLYTHYYFLFPWFATVLFLAITPGADRRLKLAWRVLVVVALVSPWYFQLTELFAQWRLTQDWVKWKLSTYSVGRVFFDSTIRYFSGNGHNLWTWHRKYEAVALLVFGVAAVIRLRQQRGRFLNSGWLLVWFCFFAAITGPLTVDFVRSTYIADNPRYASAALPAFCLIGGFWLSALEGRWWLVAVSILAVCWTPQLASIVRQRGRSYQPIREAAREMDKRVAADDLVLIHSIPTGAMAFARYYTGAADVATWVGQLGQRRVPESLEALIAGRKRVYVVKLHAVGEPAPEEDWLAAHGVRTHERKLSGVELTEYRPAQAPTF